MIVTKIHWTATSPPATDRTTWNVLPDQTDLMEEITGLVNGVPVHVSTRSYDTVLDKYSPFTANITVTPNAAVGLGPAASELVLWSRPSPSTVGAGITAPANQILPEVTVTGQHKWRDTGGFEFLWSGSFTYNNYDFDNTFRFSVSNITVTFNNCNFSGSGGGNTLCPLYWLFRNGSSHQNITVVCNDCTFEKFSSAAINPAGIHITYNRCVIRKSGGDAAKAGPAQGTTTWNMTMRQCYIDLIGDAFYNQRFNNPFENDGVTPNPLYRSYVEADGVSASIHADGIQAEDMQQQSHLVMIGCYWNCPHPATVGGMVSDGDGHPDYNDWRMGGQTALLFAVARNLDIVGDLANPSFLIEGNWFNGGNYTIQMDSKGSHPRPTGGLIRYNHFYHGYNTGLYNDSGAGQAEYLGNAFEYGPTHALAGQIVNCDSWFQNRTGWPAPQIA